jgi:hypothetical protein
MLCVGMDLEGFNGVVPRDGISSLEMWLQEPGGRPCVIMFGEQRCERHSWVTDNTTSAFTCKQNKASCPSTAMQTPRGRGRIAPTRSLLRH